MLRKDNCQRTIAIGRGGVGYQATNALENSNLGLNKIYNENKFLE